MLLLAVFLLFIGSVQGLLERDEMDILKSYYLETRIERKDGKEEVKAGTIPNVKFARFKLSHISKKRQEQIGEDTLAEFADRPVNIRFLANCHHALDIVFTPSDKLGQSTLKYYWKEENGPFQPVSSKTIIDVMGTVNSTKIQIDVWFIINNEQSMQFLINVNGHSHAWVKAPILFFHINTIRVDTENMKYYLEAFSSPDENVDKCCGMDTEPFSESPQCPCGNDNSRELPTDS